MDHKKRYDLVLYLLVQMSLWLFTVDFSQTVLWETGACNYLFCTTLVFAFLWRVRSSYRAQTGSSRGREALACVGLFLFGIIAGWCSENTSGACIVFVLLYLLQSLRKTHRATAKLIFAAAGSITGFLIMILAPGNRIRAAQTEASDPESYSGLAGMIARFQKVSLNMNREFFWLMAAFLVSAVILSLLALKRDGGRNRRRKVLWQSLRTSLLYFFLYGITCYALIMTQETQVRAYFGAGIFLILAVLQNLTDLLILEKEDGTQILGRTCDIRRPSGSPSAFPLCLHGQRNQLFSDLSGHKGAGELDCFPEGCGKSGYHGGKSAPGFLQLLLPNCADGTRRRSIVLDQRRCGGLLRCGKDPCHRL